jgi:hypothetical protein
LNPSRFDPRWAPIPICAPSGKNARINVNFEAVLEIAILDVRPQRPVLIPHIGGRNNVTVPTAVSIFKPGVEAENVFSSARRHVAVDAIRLEFQASLQHETLARSSTSNRPGAVADSAASASYH